MPRGVYQRKPKADRLQKILRVQQAQLPALVETDDEIESRLTERFDVVSCRAKDDKVAGAAIFELKLEGRAVEIDEIKHFLHRAVKAINEDNKPAYPEDTAGISLIDVDDRKRGRIVTFIKKLAEKL